MAKGIGIGIGIRSKQPLAYIHVAKAETREFEPRHGNAPGVKINFSKCSSSSSLFVWGTTRLYTYRPTKVQCIGKSFNYILEFVSEEKG
jgi:hypothetical protein